MPRVRRILLAAICAVAFGVVCTVAVSWLIVWRSPTSMEVAEYHIINRADQRIGVAHGRAWGVDAWGCWIASSYANTSASVPADSLPPSVLLRMLPDDYSSIAMESSSGYLAGVRLTGWPFRAMAQSHGVTPGLREWSVPNLNQGRTRLPLRPLLPGFLLNTLFYAAIGLTVWFTPGLIRRRIRRVRQRCPACGYDLRNLPATACPECGKTSSPQPRTADPGLD